MKDIVSTYQNYRNNLSHSHYKAEGVLISVKGPTIYATMPDASIGEVCEIEKSNKQKILAQVVSFSDNKICLAPFKSTEGLSPGDKITSFQKNLSITLSDSLQGSVIDALGNIISKETEKEYTKEHKILQKPPTPLSRPSISKRLHTGLNGLDQLCTLGYGQRIGLFAGAGVGKSTLLGLLAKNAKVDVTVIALVGERGREVREFIEDCLGEEGMKKTVLVVSTSDEPSIQRQLAAYTATTVAEYFRDQGKSVLLLVDSLTRMARAVREVSLSAGELPVRHGYTNSVFTELPKLIERAGNNNKGSITAVYTVLSNHENEIDPLGEEIKSLLDGHIMLSQDLAKQGIWPAIDYCSSISRLCTKLRKNESNKTLETVKKLLFRLQKDKDILLFGGSADEELEFAISIEDQLRRLLSEQYCSKDFEIKYQELKKLIIKQK